MEGTYPSKDSLSCLLVDHLNDTNDCAPDTDWHAEDGPGGVTRLLVNVRVEPLVVVDLTTIIRNIYLLQIENIRFSPRPR